jgi:hypothetical protein
VTLVAPKRAEPYGVSKNMKVNWATLKGEG